MSLENQLQVRSNHSCELCGNTENLSVYLIPPDNEESIAKAILTCDICLGQITENTPLDVNHWHCLSGSMWSEHIPVQVMAYRILAKLSSEGWANELKEQMYLDDETLDWANALESSDDEAFALDSNGAKLVAGDAVTLIKDLEVKGANFTAKRGTLVKNISINGIEGQIEGRVNGTHIVLLTKFLKKAN